MKDTILENLENYFGNEFAENETLLSTLLNKVIANVILYRNYPSTYTQEMIEEDIVKYQSKIEDIVISLFNRVGAEGTYKHHENGITDDFVRDNELDNFIIPIARVGE